MTDTAKRPVCFGDLERVFPKAVDGLRHTPTSCMICKDKVECLRSAMAGSDGLLVREEVTDRAYASGMISFFERWSQKKEFQRRKKRICDTKKGGDHEDD